MVLGISSRILIVFFSFAFVEYESRRDADDAYHEMHNKRIGRDDLLKIEVKPPCHSLSVPIILNMTSGLALRLLHLGALIQAVTADVTVARPAVAALHLPGVVVVTTPLVGMIGMSGIMIGMSGTMTAVIAIMTAVTVTMIVASASASAPEALMTENAISRMIGIVVMMIEKGAMMIEEMAPMAKRGKVGP